MCKDVQMNDYGLDNYKYAQFVILVEWRSLDLVKWKNKYIDRPPTNNLTGSEWSHMISEIDHAHLVQAWGMLIKIFLDKI